MGTRERAIERRKRIVGNIAANFEEAERWDLEFWQRQGPEARLSALMSVRDDLAKIKRVSIERSLHKEKGPHNDE